MKIFVLWLKLTKELKLIKPYLASLEQTRGDEMEEDIDIEGSLDSISKLRRIYQRGAIIYGDNGHHKTSELLFELKNIMLEIESIIGTWRKK